MAGTAVFVHDTAVVDAGARVGAGSKIWHFSHVSRGAVIGEGCVLGQNVFIGEGVCIGDRVKVQNNVSIYAGVVVESDVFLGPSCVFTNVRRPRAFIDRSQAFVPTRVARGASISANATIVCGHHLGSYCMVGAGAVVVDDVPAHALVVGTPARRIGWACRCGERLPVGDAAARDAHEVACESCETRYRIDAASCHPASEQAG